MKKFTKLFLSCTAMAVVTAAVATSAMAAGGVTATYTAAEGENPATATLTSTYDAEQKTLLILTPGTTLSNLTNITGDQISQYVKAIDQVVPTKDGDTEQPIKVALPSDLPNGKYVVFMGGDGQTYDGTLQIGEVTGTEILIGNVNMDSRNMINGVDATAVLKHVVVSELDEHADKLTGAALQAAAQCNKLGDARANGVDATYILTYSVSSDLDEEDRPAMLKGADVGVGKTITVDAE